MLKPRIIPCLLIDNDELVKTKNFKNPKYIGDPINAVKIFNEKKADELIVLDISATFQNKEPNYELIKKLVKVSRMPLCYGGGIRKIDQVNKIIEFGVEKISLNSAACENPSLLANISKEIGSQSLVVTQDIMYLKNINDHIVFNQNGLSNSNQKIIDKIKFFEDLGVGELVINSIDCDGMMQGYDEKIIDKIMKISNIPVTFVGGAGNLEHLKQVIFKNRFIGLAAGSLFVYKGKFNAVLINYPSEEDRMKIYT